MCSSVCNIWRETNRCVSSIHSGEEEEKAYTTTTKVLPFIFYTRMTNISICAGLLFPPPPPPPVTNIISVTLLSTLLFCLPPSFVLLGVVICAYIIYIVFVAATCVWLIFQTNEAIFRPRPPHPSSPFSPAPHRRHRHGVAINKNRPNDEEARRRIEKKEASDTKSDCTIARKKWTLTLLLLLMAAVLRQWE